MRAMLRTSLIIALGAFVADGKRAPAAAASLQAATALGTLAASMAPGTWAELQTIGFGGGAFLEPCGDLSNIVEYADSATWDPVSRQFLFFGTSHGTCYGSRFVVYRDSDNTWWKGPFPPGIPEFGSVAHAYDHNTIDPATGDVYYRHYGGVDLYKYSTNGTRAWSVPSRIPLPRGIGTCCASLEYFPDRNGLLYVDGSEGVYWYDKPQDRWTHVANTGLLFDPSLPTLAMASYDTFIEYNPVHRVLIFGGGGGSRDVYKLDAAAVITKLRNSPSDLTMSSVHKLLTVDPVSGKYLVFNTNGRFYEYDVSTDTWSLQAGTHPLAARGYFECCESPVSTYGVIMVADHNSGKVYLYKHSPGGGGPPPPPPSGDTDGDGLPDSWEITHFGNLAQGPGDDPDADGVTNLSEFQAGSDPRSASSVPGGGGTRSSGDKSDGCGATGLEVLLLGGFLGRRRSRLQRPSVTR